MNTQYNLITGSLIKLSNYCKNENYKGYSLYDSHNSFIPFNKLGKSISFISNQIVKRSPVNFRPILGIKKDYNPKGMGLFLHAYSNLYGNVIFKPNDLSNTTSFFYNWLKDNYSKGYSGYCWGYNFDWPRSDGKIIPAFTPTSVVTGFICRSILKYHDLSNDPGAIEIIQGASKFILNDILLTEHEDGICFSYFPHIPNITVNANLLAAEILAYSDYLNKTSENKSLISQVLNFTMNRQNRDGSWFYSFDINTGKPKKQIDFHQGYVLESILRICEYSSFNLNDYIEPVKKGLMFYKSKQFDNDGHSLWRYPKQWPIDIHNQSQGIITFSKFSHLDNSFLSFANTIAEWTIQNMQSKKGNFYYQKWLLITSRVSYMRWNQAWMLLGLSTLIEKLLDKEAK